MGRDWDGDGQSRPQFYIVKTTKISMVYEIVLDLLKYFRIKIIFKNKNYFIKFWTKINREKGD